MKVHAMIEWLKTQPQDATVEIMVTEVVQVVPGVPELEYYALPVSGGALHDFGHGVVLTLGTEAE